MTKQTSPYDRSENKELPRLCYIHIPKSAGTYLRHILQYNYDNEDICDFRFQGQFLDSDPSMYISKKLFSSHIGFEFAETLNSDMITILRNPFDRVLSLYYYWKEVQGGPEQIKNMDLDGFLDIQEMWAIENLDNVQTWQLAFGHTAAIRRRYREISDDALLSQAIENIEKLSIVGVYENLSAVTHKIQEKYGLKLPEAKERVNATKKRASLAQTPMSIRDKIYSRNSLDVALYDHVLRKLLREP